MYKGFLFCLVGILAISACQNRTGLDNELDLQVRLSPDSSAVMLKNMPAELLTFLQSDSLDTVFCKQFFAVYPETGDPDLRDLQKPLPGNYQLRDSALLFTPLVPFVKGQAYFVQVYPKNLQLNLLQLFKKEGLQSKSKPFEYKFGG